MLQSVLATAGLSAAPVRRQLLLPRLVAARLLLATIMVMALRLHPASSTSGLFLGVLDGLLLRGGRLLFLLVMLVGELLPLPLLLWWMWRTFLPHHPAPMGTRTAPTRPGTDLGGEKEI